MSNRERLVIESLIAEIYSHMDNNIIIDKAFIIEVLEIMTEIVNKDK